jgi:UDP-N-acetyl-D-glucosamine/UDP-N-acetyl-D-galactosamine dehydrogenase
MRSISLIGMGRSSILYGRYTYCPPSAKSSKVAKQMSEVVAVVGLGYVGLPLAVEFGKKFDTIGYDLSDAKIDSYRRLCDPTGEVSSEDLRAAARLTPTSDPTALQRADFIVIAVPTPVDVAHLPDFSPLIGASTTVAQHMKKGAIVVFESTVYPGATEEVCVPVLERHSGMRWKQDFHVGYSPERVNPGDKEHTVSRIIKVVSGDDEQTLAKVGDLYASIITAGVHRASSIKVAEAAKVIENTQRDLNIALMNELALIFGRIGIDTLEVLQAAGTKWNFLPFRPGLVGGHCIGVDPYYLTHKAEMIGYHPQVILAGRRINDGMGAYIAQQTLKQLIKNGSPLPGAKVIVLGLTFKENCPDLRNSKVADVIRELKELGCIISVHDPIADSQEAAHHYDMELTPWEELPAEADAVVAAVPHRSYLTMPLRALLSPLKKNGVFIDVKSAFDRTAISEAGFRMWRL